MLHPLPLSLPKGPGRCGAKGRCPSPPGGSWLRRLLSMEAAFPKGGGRSSLEPRASTLHSASPALALGSQAPSAAGRRFGQQGAGAPRAPLRPEQKAQSMRRKGSGGGGRSSWAMSPAMGSAKSSGELRGRGGASGVLSGPLIGSGFWARLAARVPAAPSCHERAQPPLAGRGEGGAGRGAAGAFRALPLPRGWGDSSPPPPQLHPARSPAWPSFLRLLLNRGGELLCPPTDRETPGPFGVFSPLQPASEGSHGRPESQSSSCSAEKASRGEIKSFSASILLCLN